MPEITVLTRSSSEDPMDEVTSGLSDDDDQVSQFGEYISLRDIQGTQYLMRKGSSQVDLPHGYGALKSQRASLISQKSLLRRSLFDIHEDTKQEVQSRPALSFQAIGGPEVIVFIFGVVFHYLLEGMTLGIQTDEASAFRLGLLLGNKSEIRP